MWQLGPIFRTLMRRKFGVFLLVAQIAFTTTIFSNLGFMTQQINKLVMQPSGIADEKLFAITVRPVNTLINYSDAERDMHDLQSLANVEQVSAMRWVPLGQLAAPMNFRTKIEKDTAGVQALASSVSHQALATLGLKIVAGRDFMSDDMDIKTASVAPESKRIIITKILADELFGKDQNAIGKIIYDGDAPREIIGVTENWLGYTMPFNERAEKTAFFPYYDETDTEHRYLIRAKSGSDRASVIEAVNQVLTRNYQNELLLWVEKIDENKANFNSFNMVLANLFIIMIISLGFVVAFAISGQTLFWITQRTKQIGIRRALGASRQIIIVQLLAENVMICILGLLIGILLSLAANQLAMQAIGILPMPPIFLFTTCLLILGVCLGSAAIPAWRASKISPSVATRSV